MARKSKQLERLEQDRAGRAYLTGFAVGYCLGRREAICEAEQGHIARPTESGFFQAQANFGFSPELKEEVERIPFKPARDSVTGRALLERTTVQIVDAETDPEYKLSKLQSLGGYHSMIGTPLLREGTPIGVFGLARRSVRPFTDKQMALLTTFADQAVIAIENARLFEEVQAR